MPETVRSLRSGSRSERFLRNACCWASILFVLAAMAAPAMGQTSDGQRASGEQPRQRTLLQTADIVALTKSCGGADPLEASFDLVRQQILGFGKVLAFEDNRLFIYAVAEVSARRSKRIRRVFLLKPSTLVVEDVVRTTTSVRPSRSALRSEAKPKITDGKIRVAEGDASLLVETLVPAEADLHISSAYQGSNRPRWYSVTVTPKQPAAEARFLQVIHVLGKDQEKPAPPSKVAKKGDRLEVTVPTGEHVFKLVLAPSTVQPGLIEVADADSKILLPLRVLPSGVMPHGGEGAKLLERWDAPYRAERMPGWDVGRPSGYLVKAVQDGTLRPGRAIVFGCGTGTNAIYLASKGFTVTGVDVAPSALKLAEQKAQKAGVNVRWIMGDVVALPKLDPVDLVFDRGCYHHVRQYNAAGYVEAVQRLSHAGTKALILAGNANEERHWGPPRVKEEEIRGDFTELFAFEWLREIHFESIDPNATQRPLAWSILLRRKGE